MDDQFWFDRWRDGQLGFHEGKPNGNLVDFGGRLGEGGRVLVPLCGKAVDLAYLAERGHTVIGVELVEQAVRQFFEGASPTITDRGTHLAYTAGAITILVGDFFAVTPALVGSIDAVYDRAALIALPPDVRPRYVAHCRALAPGAPGLLVSLEYDQARMDGPPFSVEEPEVRAHYGDVELLRETPIQNPRMQEAGVAGLAKCFAFRL